MGGWANSFNYFVSHLGFSATPDAVTDFDPGRRQFIAGAAASAAVFQPGQGLAEIYTVQAGGDEFQAREIAEELFSNVEADQWGRVAFEQGWDRSQVDLIAEHLKGMMRLDHETAKSAITKIENAGVRAGSAQRHAETAARGLDQARDSVERMADTIEKSIDIRALNAETRRGEAPDDVALDDADQALLDGAQARYIEQTQDPDVIRQAYMDAYGERIMENVGKGGQVTNDIAAAKARDTTILKDREGFEAKEQAVAGIELNGREQHQIETRVKALLDRYDEAVAIEDPNHPRKDFATDYQAMGEEGRALFERAARLNATMAASDEAKEAVLDLYREAPDQADINIEIDRFVGADITGTERLKALQDAGLEMDPSYQPEIDRLRTDLAGNSAEGREQLIEQGRDAIIAEPLPDQDVSSLRMRIDRLRTVPREEVLGELDAHLSERFGPEVAERYMTQIEPGYERTGLTIGASADTAQPDASGLSDEVREILDGVSSPSYKRALTDSMDGASIDRRGAMSDISANYRNLDAAIQEFRSQTYSPAPTPEGAPGQEQKNSMPMGQDI